ncbi:unnamed protein product [Brassica oleracea var. botrytis]|uniref:Uncharacterized protein n=1 Tax=Brassica oleracea TaxID=3712 RepID=A0A3P6ALS2_BRAOL|nr:unnamed protein product [Brassica oleracea]
MAFYRSLRKLAETNPLKKARLFFQLPAVEPFLRSHRRFRRAAPTLHAQIASPFLMVRPSPRTSIPLFSTLETAPVRDASSLARKRRVLRKVKDLSVRLICGDDGRVRGWKWRDFAYSTENHVKPLLELTNPQHKDFCFSMECLWLTPFELSTEAPPPVSSSSNQYL